MWTLGLTGAGAYFGLRGGEKKKEQGPPINATSEDEEKFIKYVHGLFGPSLGLVRANLRASRTLQA